MKSQMTLGLVILMLGFAGCSEGMNGTGSNSGSSQPHVVNRPTDNGTMPTTNSGASGTSANPDMNGAKPGAMPAPDSGTNNNLPTTGSGANGAAPSTYAPGQSGAMPPDPNDNGTNAGAKAPTETTTPPNGR